MIYQQKITQIGSFHINHSEDYVISTEIGKSRLLIAAMDGCTMGDESYFASALCGRLLRKISKSEFYREYVHGIQVPIDVQFKRVLSVLFDELISVKNILQLERNELLTTLLIGIIDVEALQGQVICLGDGVVCIDGQLTEFDQGNQPDYLAYHLTENFETWYATVNQKITFQGFRDISLCTDGILSFVDAETNQQNEVVTEHLIHYLLVDQAEISNENGLVKKLHRIKTKWNMINTDDLGIIRITLGK